MTSAIPFTELAPIDVGGLLQRQPGRYRRAAARGYLAHRTGRLVLHLEGLLWPARVTR